MNIDFYHKYKHYEEKNLKKESTKYINAFISSFNDEEEIYSWVWSYLLDAKDKTRYEIFRDLIYPTLKKGFIENDFKSILWLGHFEQHLYGIAYIDNYFIGKNKSYFYKKCHTIDPNNKEVQNLLLETLIQRLQYSIHEWPSGILYGINGATYDECLEIESDLSLAKKLDKKQEYFSFLKDFENKLLAYKYKL